jgi:hypothetical protein
MESDYSAIPERWRFVAQHGSDPLFWLGRSPLDLSNRVSLALVGAAVVGAGKLRAGTRWGLVAMTLVGSVMVLGPYARWGESLVLVDEGAVSLPFKWFGELHPTLGRLTWPERWGVLVTLGLLPLAARASRPRLWALVIGLECLLFSGNLPLQSISLRHQTCWSALEDASGAVLELPLARTGLMAPWVGVHRRFHRRALVNPILLPPGANYPDAWKDWLEEQELMKWLQRFEEGRWPQEPGADAVRALRAAGVSALAVDAEPGSLLTPGGLSRYKVGLGKHLGPPIDLGCALVWWLDTEVAPPEGIEDGDEWREEATAWKEAHPAPDLDTLIEPTWDAVRHQPFHSGD